LTGGASITSVTFGPGQGGILEVDSKDIQIIGSNGIGIGSTLGSVSLGSGASGDVGVNTDRLLIAQDGTLQATAFGSGNAGNVVVNARESIDIIGTLSGDSTSTINSSPFLWPGSLARWPKREFG
jgi:hypothetical protein